MRSAKSTYIVAALVLALLALAGCDMGGGSGTTTKSNPQLLKEAIENGKKLKSYHVVLNANAGGVQVDMSGDVDVANRKYNIEATAMGFPTGAIRIGDDIYIKEMTGGYKKGTEKDGSSYDSFLKTWEDANTADIDKAADALKDGSPATETINGVETKHITADAEALGSLGSSGGTTGTSEITDGTIDFWISTGNTPQIQQMKMVGKSEGNDVTFTMKYSKHNETLTIEAPTEVNE
jgi:hypothetical protein